MPTNAYKKCPNKCLLSLANGLGFAQQDRKLLNNNYSTLSNTTEKTMAPTPHPTPPLAKTKCEAQTFTIVKLELGIPNSQSYLLVSERAK